MSLVDDDRRRGTALSLAGAGSLLAVAPQAAPIPQRPAVYGGTILLILGIIVLYAGETS